MRLHQEIQDIIYLPRNPTHCETSKFERRDEFNVVNNKGEIRLDGGEPRYFDLLIETGCRDISEA